jgi:hypothetical protein
MTALPEGRSGRFAALGILVVLLAAAYLAIISPVISFYASTADTLDQRREQVRKYRNAVNDLPRLREGAKRQSDAASAANMLLTGASDAVAAAELQSSLKDIVEGEGTTIMSAAILPVEAEGAFRRVGLRIAFSGDIEVLTTVLLQVEEARPMLFVGDFDVHQSSAGESDGENPMLAVSLDVFGYRAR